MGTNESNRVIIYLNDKTNNEIEALQCEIQQEKGYKVSRSQVLKEIVIKHLMERSKCE